MSENKEFVFLEQLVTKVDHDSAMSEKDAEIENLRAENKECISRFLHEQRIKRVEEELKSKDAMIDSLQLRLESQIENVNFYKNNYDETDRIILDKNDEIERLKSALDVAINVLHVVSSMHPQGNPEPKIELAKKAIERIEDILSV